jgi:hypothetical protein
VTGVEFWLPQDDRFFYYGSFLPNFKRVEEFIVPGSIVQLDTPRGKHDIWRLEVGGEILANREQIAKAHHDNGVWGLLVSIMMLLSGAGLLWFDRTPPVRSNRL